MSGGVDSSVTAALLQKQGYDVTGVYMKNWSQDLPGMVCPWKEDYQDAKRVAVQLGIPFKMYDFETEYRHKVVEYMIEEYKAGRTPNPDIMCNQEVKFKLFLSTAFEDGADFIATGHYARIIRSPSLQRRVLSSHPSPMVLTAFRATGVPQGSPPAASASRGLTRNRGEKCELWAGVDTDKDQSYFLCRVTEAALQKSLMPIGEYKKAQVRELARKFGLATADKKDSQGICFVGKVGIKDFLQQYVQPSPGKIIDQHGKVIGEHDGALFYTIGQRQGLGVGGGLPYYVVGKDMNKNEVYVTSDLQDTRLWNKEFTIASIHWINDKPEEAGAYTVRTRYHGDLLDVNSIKELRDGNWHVALNDEVRALAPGQSAALYQDDRVVGSGILVG